MPHHCIAVIAILVFGLLAQAFGAEPRLLNVARIACTGVLEKNPRLLSVLQLDLPVYYFRELPKPVEQLMISVRQCPEPSMDVQFIVGHFVVKGEGYYYKVSPQVEGIRQAARHYVDRGLNDIIYKPVAPVSEIGATKIYAESIQDDYQALIATVIAKWGR